MRQSYDLLLAGGGLANGLLAYRLATRFPDLRIGIVERGERVGGNHTWCFHETDVSAAARQWLTPFIAHSWPTQEVRFPARQRVLETPYNAVTAERFAEVLEALPNVDILTGTGVVQAAATHLQLEDQRTLTARAVIDGTGARPSPHLTLGFQKFLGREVRFAEPHGLDRPIIMDATVPQTDGYRFVYVLPFTADTALIEDTYYADGHALDDDALTAEIDAYAARQGWEIAETLRAERGVLPIVLEGDIDAFWAERQDGAAPIGLAAGLFHPVTGYSVPDAAALADLVAAAWPLDTDGVRAVVAGYAAKRWESHGFYRLLNRMLFRAAEPKARYIVLQRFYGLPRPLIERFYAGTNTTLDQLRVLAGKPPVPLGRALKVMRSRRPRGNVDEGILG